MDKLYQNKVAFSNISPRNLFGVSLLGMLMFIIIILLSLKYPAYDNYLTKGLVTCNDDCIVHVELPTSIKLEKVKYNNKYWYPKILEKTTEIDEEALISYNLYSLSNDLNFQDKEIVELNIYYNKQRIIKKFIDMLF